MHFIITIFLDFFRPDLPRPIRVNLIIPILFIILCVTLVLLPSLESPKQLIIGFIITLAGIPVYYIGFYSKNKPAYNRVSRGLERFCQLLFQTVFVEDEAEKAV